MHAGRPIVDSLSAKRCWLRLIGIYVLLLGVLLPASGYAQLFPFYDEDTIYTDEDYDGREVFAMYPFYEERYTSNTSLLAIHPLFSRERETDTQNLDFDILWPLFNYRYRPDRGGVKNYRRGFLFPIYYNRKETRFNSENSDIFLLPIWFQGDQGTRGRYRILFPIIWYAYNARLAVPLFPPREQTFAAIFPLVGDFRGYWNRDRIAFFLWPLLVYSSAGKGDDFNEVYSFLWPIFGLHKGPKVSGFRIWPLYATVKKEGEFRRSYWLWPLGHYRKGRISKDNPEQEDVTLFIPFYAKFRRPNISLDMVFPIYGRLEVNDRVSHGYALAIYNRETNTRTKIREDRYLWFLIRDKTYLPGYTAEDADPNATVGGGFFPFYTRSKGPKRINKNIIWPLHTYRWSKYDEYTFERSYIIPFYSFKKRLFNNGEYAQSKFFFPFFRKSKTLSDQVSANYLHLFFYGKAAPMDRNWAPLWTFWEMKEDLNTGEKTIRWFKNAWKYEHRPDGSTRRQANLFLFDYESIQEPGKPKTGHTRFLFGLVGKHREPELKTEILGFKF